MFSKLLKLDNFKKNLKYLFYINLIDKKLSYIFSLYNYKYLINYKFNYLYKKYYILKQKVNIIYKKKYNKYKKKKKKFLKRYNKNYKSLIKKIFKKKYNIIKEYIKKIKYKYNKKLNIYIYKILKIFFYIKYINNLIFKYNNIIQKLIKFKIKIMNIINKYLLIYYFYNIKNNLFNKIIFVVKNEIPKDTNIILSPQIYLNILKKKKIIINELSGYILIDYQYSIYLKKKIKKKINKL